MHVYNERMEQQSSTGTATTAKKLLYKQNEWGEWEKKKFCPVLSSIVLWNGVWTLDAHCTHTIVDI